VEYKEALLLRRRVEFYQSFPYDAVAVKVDGDDLALCIQLHLDIACRLQRVTFALSADQNSSSQHSIVLVLFECELELAGFQQRALEYRVVNETCLMAHITMCRVAAWRCVIQA